ncbi:hypothetical protein Cus16_0526 [Curtobacterium sp. ER1/6]|nr:hypothetical protein Cus16_0526 [Curtobacterium sp. ER1/6]
MHEPPRVGGPDVHTGTLPDRLESLEDGEVACGVVGAHLPMVPTGTDSLGPGQRRASDWGQPLRGQRNRPPRMHVSQPPRVQMSARSATTCDP